MTVVECLDDYSRELYKDPALIKFRCHVPYTDQECIYTYNDIVNFIETETSEQEEKGVWHF